MTFNVGPIPADSPGVYVTRLPSGITYYQYWNGEFFGTACHDPSTAFRKGSTKSKYQTVDWRKLTDGEMKSLRGLTHIIGQASSPSPAAPVAAVAPQVEPPPPAPPDPNLAMMQRDEPPKPEPMTYEQMLAAAIPDSVLAPKVRPPAPNPFSVCAPVSHRLGNFGATLIQ